MDFVYDDCQWIRDFAHKIWWSLTDSDVQDVSISSVTPSNLGPMLAEAMMETLTDKEAVIRALEFTASSESELCLSENVMVSVKCTMTSVQFIDVSSTFRTLAAASLRKILKTPGESKSE